MLIKIYTCFGLNANQKGDRLAIVVGRNESTPNVLGARAFSPAVFGVSPNAFSPANALFSRSFLSLNHLRHNCLLARPTESHPVKPSQSQSKRSLDRLGFSGISRGFAVQKPLIPVYCRIKPLMFAFSKFFILRAPCDLRSIIIRPTFRLPGSRKTHRLSGYA
jgi:hypothetical protein